MEIKAKYYSSAVNKLRDGVDTTLFASIPSVNITLDKYLQVEGAASLDEKITDSASIELDVNELKGCGK